MQFTNQSLLLVIEINKFIKHLFSNVPKPYYMMLLICSRSKLAVVDENNTCLVYNIKNNELLFQVCYPFVMKNEDMILQDEISR